MKRLETDSRRWGFIQFIPFISATKATSIDELSQASPIDALFYILSIDSI